MTHLSVDLPEELGSFVESMVEGGHYADAGEVVREALRKLEREDEEKLIALRADIEDGFASGLAEGDVFARVREKAGLPARSAR